ncbi:hypothetical protein SGFS_004620 [Streptomyces graminofaciens]|uniref:Uncharacterized protein n=1 Tax=Streptomyces graminofaciens TaxID=68212 RepID=A0ABN5V7A7_9ACTN|nr:hypothetical protein SGFS_004620 [Streptomyces graminofaciens]
MERATRLFQGVITRLEQGGWPLGLVDEVHVFGLYVWGRWSRATSVSWLSTLRTSGGSGSRCARRPTGRDPYGGMRQAPRGRTRGISFQFRRRDTLRDEGCGLFLLWSQRESVDLGGVVPHGERLFGAGQPERCFVDLGWSSFGRMGHLADGGLGWPEAMRPHDTKPMGALFIQPCRADSR